MSRGETREADDAAAGICGGGAGRWGWSRDGGLPLGDGSCGEMISPPPPERRIEMGETVALDVAPAAPPPRSL